ncbi:MULTISPECIES: hypothetical protein [unclassified Neisseria]|uniref:hypothetical protein n=1 Tax=unclassified Neisseria TaxID=2623750 RepID=UPI0010724CD6|nr:MULTISPECIES: hypothetical protein [unclassified Neisseria]MBF0803934.1 hypothetical protein [Neisseria sp. 19428wB4_WF04]TFU43361.1 hypothetical protein E4T99_06125 [Neisseria sp. WF04]
MDYTRQPGSPKDLQGGGHTANIEASCKTFGQTRQSPPFISLPSICKKYLKIRNKFTFMSQNSYFAMSITVQKYQHCLPRSEGNAV